MRRLLFTVILVFIAGTASARDPSVIQIMERNYEVNRTRDRSIEITMQMLSDSGKKRIRRLTNRALLMKDGINEKRLIRFHFPPDLEGAGFLVLEQSDGDDHMWLYLPTLRKSRRKLASDKKDSFLGTEFSYGDITGPKVSEYTYVLKGEDTLDGFPCWVIESTPASDDVLKDYGYSKRTDYIRKDTYTHQKAMFYDPDGERLKTLSCSDPYEADPENHKWFIKKRVMENHQNGRKTILQMDNIQINIGIEDKEFSVRYLERGR